MNTTIQVKRVVKAPTFTDYIMAIEAGSEDYFSMEDANTIRPVITRIMREHRGREYRTEKKEDILVVRRIK